MRTRGSSNRMVAGSLGVVLALAMAAGACSDGHQDASSAAPSGDEIAGEEQGLASVFPLPGEEAVSLFAYEIVEDDDARIETATFLLDGPGPGAVIDFYDRLLGAMGYVVDDVVDRDGLLAVAISDPADPAVSGSIEVGPVASEGFTVQLHQQRVELGG